MRFVETLKEPMRPTVSELQSAINISRIASKLVIPTAMVARLDRANTPFAQVVCATAVSPTAPRLPPDVDLPLPRGASVAVLLKQLGRCGRAVGTLLYDRHGNWELWQLIRRGSKPADGRATAVLSRRFRDEGTALVASGRAGYRLVDPQLPLVIGCRSHRGELDRHAWETSLHRMMQSRPQRSRRPVVTVRFE